jgi:DNA-binding Xre family transcriptional regulator
MKPVDLIRANIERILREKRLRGCDLAKALGVTDSHVSQIRTGKRWAGRIEWVTYSKVCKALGVDELELIKPLRHNKENNIQKIAREVDGLPYDDVELVFNFLGIVKNHDILNPDHYQALSGVISMLEDELVRKKGMDAIIKPASAE